MKRCISFGLIGLAYSCAVSAQGSVTLYGTIDTGISYSNNQLGHASYQMVSGVPVGSNWGLKGKEDLGNGLSAVFDLENGFNGANGASYENGMFARQARMGLSSDKYGTVTFGRQYDTNVDFVSPYTSNGAWAGWYFSHPNDVDNTDNGFRINNSVKYVSAPIGGLTFGGLYSFGGVPGQFSKHSVWSAGAKYDTGTFSFGAGYLSVDSPATAVDGYVNGAGYTNTVYGKYLAAASRQNIWGAGGSYTIGSASILFSFTDTTFVNGQSGRNVSFRNAEAALGYHLTPALFLAGSYTYTFGQVNATDESPKYHQINLMTDYHLSKRTDVYAMAVFQKAAGSAGVAQITGFNASSTDRQLALRVGLKHTF